MGGECSLAPDRTHVVIYLQIALETPAGRLPAACCCDAMLLWELAPWAACLGTLSAGCGPAPASFSGPCTLRADEERDTGPGWAGPGHHTAVLSTQGSVEPPGSP